MFLKIRDPPRRKKGSMRAPEVEVELLPPIHDDDIKKAVINMLEEKKCSTIREIKVELERKYGILAGEDKIRTVMRRLQREIGVTRHAKGLYCIKRYE